MSFFTVIISIIIAEGAGIIGSIFTISSVQGWYLTLAKPSWNPPGWVFGPVWTILYALMGIAAAIIWQQKETPGAKIALWIYGIHLVFNVLWSIIFFGLKNPGLAFAEIVLLLVFVVITTMLFWKINPKAGALLIPYIAWVSFAAYLNYTIWQIN